MSSPRPARQRRPRQAHAPYPTPPVRNASTHPLASTKDISPVKFHDLVLQKKLSHKIQDNIPFVHMTEVQAATIDTALSGSDIFARAKTGTGKTLAFLVPSIQHILSSPRLKGQTSIVVVSPTRELARQIAQEAETLTANVDIGVQCVVGGVNMSKEQRALKDRACDILIATPGRFVDHVKNSGLGDKLKNVCTLVLDEADTLLEGGFRNDLLAILGSLPDRNKKPRQTLLFSATVSEEVKSIASIALLPTYQFITTVSETEQSTHWHVKQEFMVAPVADAYPLLLRFIGDRKTENDGAGRTTKLIVFAPAANVAAVVYAMLEALQPKLSMPVFQVHSRLSQPQRDRSTSGFRDAPSGVLVASDVAARGLDFTDISYVIQVGFPSTPDQYVHRLGRTARAGKEGAGLLILTPHELPYLNKAEMKQQPLVQRPDAEILLGPTLDPSRHLVASAMSRVDNKTKIHAYQGWLGYHNSFMKLLKWKPSDLVEAANAWAQHGMLYQGHGGLPPPIHKTTVGKMHLKGVPGLNIDHEEKVRPSRPQKKDGAAHSNVRRMAV